MLGPEDVLLQVCGELRRSQHEGVAEQQDHVAGGPLALGQAGFVHYLARTVHLLQNDVHIAKMSWICRNNNSVKPFIFYFTSPFYEGDLHFALPLP